MLSANSLYADIEFFIMRVSAGMVFVPTVTVAPEAVDHVKAPPGLNLTMAKRMVSGKLFW